MQPTTINFTPPSEATHDILSFVALVAVGITLLVHLMVAIAVMTDSAIILRRRGVRTMFFGTPGWTFIALMTGLFGLVTYWLMHHSTLRASVEESRDDKPVA